MFDLFGSELPLAVRFFIAFLVVLALIGLTAWVVRRFGANRLGSIGARGRQPRLAVIDAASVDGRRRLVLIRRDNIEHLLMIGGPTDVVIEPNIVRAAARETTREPMRPAPASETAWPLQPANEPTRPYRAPAPEEPRGQLPEEPRVHPLEEPHPHRTPTSEEPWLPPEAGARPRPADSLSGLANELSSKLTPPQPEAQPIERRDSRFAKPPAAPEPAPSPSVDQNLSEMAQQLEAALRRAPLPEGRPPVTDPFATQARPHPVPTPVREVKPPEPKVEPKIPPKFEARIEPKPEPKIEPKFEAKIEKIEPKPVTPKPVAKLEAKPESKLEATPDSDKNLYDNLEEEMASLLGRPSSKS
jgi:flagellar protein FliO/FliZ